MVDVYTLGAAAKDMGGFDHELIALSIDLKQAKDAIASFSDELRKLRDLAAAGPSTTGAAPAAAASPTGMEAVWAKQHAMAQLTAQGAQVIAFDTLLDPDKRLPTATDAGSLSLASAMLDSLGGEHFKDIVASVPNIEVLQALMASWHDGTVPEDLGKKIADLMKLRPQAMQPGMMPKEIHLLIDAIAATHGQMTFDDYAAVFRADKGHRRDQTFTYNDIPRYVQEVEHQGGDADAALANIAALSNLVHGAAKSAPSLWKQFGLADKSGAVIDLGKFDANPFAWVDREFRFAVERMMNAQHISAHAAIQALIPHDAASAALAENWYLNAGLYRAAGAMNAPGLNADGQYTKGLTNDPTLKHLAEQAKATNDDADHPERTEIKTSVAKAGEWASKALDLFEKGKAAYELFKFLKPLLRGAPAKIGMGEAFEAAAEFVPYLLIKNTTQPSKEIGPSKELFQPSTDPYLLHADYFQTNGKPGSAPHPNPQAAQAVAQASKPVSALDPAQLVRTANLAKGAGADTARGVAEGVKSGQGAVAAAAVAMADGAVKQFKTSTQIASPSRVFAMLGRELVAGLVLGVRGAQPSLLAAMSGLALRVATPWTKGAPAKAPLVMGAPAKGPWSQAQRPALVAPRQDGGAQVQRSPVYLDGKKVGEIVTHYLARQAGRAQSGASSFDPTMGLSPVGMGYGF